jgi:hypothetical protein
LLNQGLVGLKVVEWVADLVLDHKVDLKAADLLRVAAKVINHRCSNKVCNNNPVVEILA